MNITHLVYSYGYWVVALLVAAESLGLPVPGETALIAAGAYAGESHHLSPWAVFVIAAAAAIAGNIAGYLIGAWGGFAIASRYGSKIRLDEHKLKVGKYVLDRQGGKVIFLGRFVSILRTYIAFLAGTVHMLWRKFAFATVAGCATWSALYTVLSYAAASTLRRLSLAFDLVLGGLAIVVVVALVVVARQRLAALGDKAEAAYPGPLR